MSRLHRMETGLFVWFEKTVKSLHYVHYLSWNVKTTAAFYTFFIHYQLTPKVYSEEDYSKHATQSPIPANSPLSPTVQYRK